MKKRIMFDMDGTLNRFYDVPNWLDDLIAHNTRPYEIAEPRVDMKALRSAMIRAKARGVTFGIISWLSKEPDMDYDLAVIEAKLRWLDKFDLPLDDNEIYIVRYGYAKSNFIDIHTENYLFDDERANRHDFREHGGIAIDPTEHDIISIINSL